MDEGKSGIKKRDAKIALKNWSRRSENVLDDLKMV